MFGRQWVVIGFALTAALQLAIGGCASSGRAGGGDLLYSTQVVNGTDAPIRATFVVGERISEPPGVREYFRSSTPRIGAGERLDFDMRCPPGYVVDRTSGVPVVMRMRVEPVAPTWERARVAWYEAVGTPPKSLRIETAANGWLAVSATGGRLEAVPQEWWPKGDQPGEAAQ